ncbi:hypothetical protein K435DRAFT_860346 [Dendrothele bispora CBS 962.96]|uniref:Uncharacterized protein n=1 Tax=Dendrothele bispora (strain CBS 962.96) TaxID=1314807 RepID=A0A4S8LY42_DENBC|nr:hypothetical protein K435DRAFT_860346 [Dendrothele bispora CBS 962.96]
MPVSGSSTTQMRLRSKTPITDYTQTVQAPALSETSTPSVLLLTPSTEWLGKQPKRSLSPEDSSVVLSCIPPAHSTPLLTVSSVDTPSSKSELTIVDDLKVEQNFSSEGKAIMNIRKKTFRPGTITRSTWAYPGTLVNEPQEDNSYTPELESELEENPSTSNTETEPEIEPEMSDTKMQAQGQQGVPAQNELEQQLAQQ